MSTKKETNTKLVDKFKHVPYNMEQTYHTVIDFFWKKVFFYKVFKYK